MTKTMFYFAWYLGVLANIVFLVVSIVKNDRVLAIIALILAISLKRFSSDVPLPKFYREKGVDKIVEKKNN